MTVGGSPASSQGHTLTSTAASRSDNSCRWSQACTWRAPCSKRFSKTVSFITLTSKLSSGSFPTSAARDAASLLDRFHKWLSAQVPWTAAACNSSTESSCTQRSGQVVPGKGNGEIRGSGWSEDDIAPRLLGRMLHSPHPKGCNRTLELHWAPWARL